MALWNGSEKIGHFFCCSASASGCMYSADMVVMDIARRKARTKKATQEKADSEAIAAEFLTGQWNYF